MWTDQVVFMYLGLYIHISASVNIYVTTINEVEMNSREMFTGKLKRKDWGNTMFLTSSRTIKLYYVCMYTF